MARKVLCFGSLNYDNVYEVNNIVCPGETIKSQGMKIFCGGKGLNQAIALSKAGAKVFVAGMVGSDGERLINEARKNRIDVSLIRQKDCESGHAIIQVDQNGQNSIIVHGGANQAITEEYIDEVLGEFSKGDLIVLQNEINFLNTIINKAHSMGMVVALNPSPVDDNILGCDIGKVDILILNEVEAEQMTGKQGYAAMLEGISAKHSGMKVVLTLGEQGSIYTDGKVEIRQGCYPSLVADTTAAGDTFTGFFLNSAVVEGKDVSYAMDIASRAASIAVSRKGAADSIPTADEMS